MAYSLVNLKPSDLKIAAWAIKIRESWRGGMSIMARKAIKNYIRYEEFDCIGKVCIKGLDVNKIMEMQPRIMISYNGDDEITNWVSALSDEGIQISPIFREILRGSIIEVDSSDEEWIPSCLEAASDDSILKKLHNLGLTGSQFQAKDRVSSPKTISQTETANNDNEAPVSSTSLPISTKISEPMTKKPQTKPSNPASDENHKSPHTQKKSRAAALTAGMRMD